MWLGCDVVSVSYLSTLLRSDFFWVRRLVGVVTWVIVVGRGGWVSESWGCGIAGESL